MAYYTLADLVDGRWAPQFGDYDRRVVADELADMARNMGRGARARLRIIRTETARGAEITAAMATLNRMQAVLDEERAAAELAAYAGR